MVVETLLVDAGFAAATGIIFAAVGQMLVRRQVSDSASRRALGLFSLWWYGLALLSLITAARSVAAAVGFVALPFHVALANLSLIPLFAALCGLVCYLVFVHTGKEAWFWPIVAFHGALLVAFLALVLYLHPYSVEPRAWSVTLAYARDPGPALGGFALATILGPVLLATLGYASLWFRARERATRFRVGVVSLAFLVWFGSALVASAFDATRIEWWPLASRAIGLLATVALVLAYHPPARIRRWLDAPVRAAAVA